MEKKLSTSMTRTREAQRLLLALAEKSGIGMSATLETLIREQATREGVQ